MSGQYQAIATVLSLTYLEEWTLQLHYCDSMEHTNYILPGTLQIIHHYSTEMDSVTSEKWPDLGKCTFWAQANFEKIQLKIIIIFQIKLFSPDLDKATIKPSCYEISY